VQTFYPNVSPAQPVLYCCQYH